MPELRQTELTLDEARKQYRSFWQLDVLTPKDGVRRCYCCGGPVAGRAAMNIWGTIVDFDVCAAHAEVDGRWADSIPVVKREPEQAARVSLP